MKKIVCFSLGCIASSIFFVFVSIVLHVGPLPHVKNIGFRQNQSIQRGWLCSWYPGTDTLRRVRLLNQREFAAINAIINESGYISRNTVLVTPYMFDPIVFEGYGDEPLFCLYAFSRVLHFVPNIHLHENAYQCTRDRVYQAFAPIAVSQLHDILH
jgi:hypothetical protein